VTGQKEPVVIKAIVLGSGAGGGFPQWNSNAPACRRARARDPAAKPRTQVSLAITADERRWFLLNASPDLRAQIEATPELQPGEGLRSSPLSGVVLTGGDVDAIAGLLHLRERQPLVVYATAPVQKILATNSIFGVLALDCVERKTVPAGCKTPLLDPAGAATGLEIEVFPVPGKVPLYMEGPDAHLATARETEDIVGVEVSETSGSARFFFIPGCAAMTPGLAQRLKGAPLVFFDGTLWTDDEMIRLGLGPKTGKRMGHMSVMGEDGTIAAFRDLGIARKVFVHINNSNPMLLDDSPERAIATAAGWEVGEDGQEITLC
jgi:pyrroloquinoline quinone biosynthesis protein B